MTAEQQHQQQHNTRTRKENKNITTVDGYYMVMDIFIDAKKVIHVLLLSFPTILETHSVLRL